MFTGLPWLSSTVTVTALVLEASASTVLGLATMVVLEADGAPATNITCAASLIEPVETDRFLSSAVVEANVAVQTPALFVLGEFGVSVLLDPELANVTA